MSKTFPSTATIRAATWIGGMILFTASTISFNLYPGSLPPYVTFCIAAFTMLGLIFPRPRIFVYTFLAGFLFIGFWMKLMVHFLWSSPFIEPIGLFDGSPGAWDKALWMSSAGLGGFALSRAIQLLICRIRVQSNPPICTQLKVPEWYVRHRRAVWVIYFLALVTLTVANFKFSFYQIGVNPQLVLPFRLNIPSAWMINLGFALALAVLIHWDMRLYPGRRFTLMFAAIFESLVCSASTLSRSAYILHAVPYALGLVEEAVSKSAALLPRWKVVVLVVALGGGLVVSLVIVQGLRWAIYPKLDSAMFEPPPVAATKRLDAPHTQSALAPDRATAETSTHHGSATVAEAVTPPSSNSSTQESSTSTSPTTGNQTTPDRKSIHLMVREALLLFIHRWIGLDAVLAVSSHGGTSPDLLKEALAESPKAGAQSIYQRISQSAYSQSSQLTFLTLPGFVAVLAYSGSLITAVLGSALLGALVIGTETAAARLLGNPYLLAVSGSAMAFVASNLNFPYLATVFMIQLWCALAGIRLLQWSPTRSSRGSLGHSMSISPPLGVDSVRPRNRNGIDSLT